MQKVQTDFLIIGGGLTGLTLGYLLSNRNADFQIIEARPRWGGRILTHQNESQAPLEMGATWLGSQHKHLLHLLKTFRLEIFKQALSDRAIYEPISTSPHQLVSLPPNDAPSYRISGGTSRLIDTLSEQIDEDKLHCSNPVNRIEEKEDHLLVYTEKGPYEAKKVISTLPPNLLSSRIEIEPNLPQPLVQLMESTHTWMGESIKIGLRYAEPFWRTKNLSGTIFSNVGPIPEMYDHSDHADKTYALKGFLNGSYFSVTEEERLAIVLKQLRKYFGNLVDQYLSYEEVVWQQEKFTFADYKNHVLPHQNNGHTLFRSAYMNDKLYIAGAETSSQFPGYMEGAVQSAKYIEQQLFKD